MNVCITTGEPAGIGPDVVVAFLLAHGERHRGVRLTLIGDRNVLAERSEALGCGDRFKAMTATNPRVTLLHVGAAAPVTAGVGNPRNAGYVLAQIDAGIAGCLDGTFDAMVTSPVNKAIVSEAGAAFRGHTEYLAVACDCATVMMFACDEMRMALATTHLPLDRVARALTRESLRQTLETVHKDMRRLFGISRPRIAVCGLNPHAGENRCLGDEEERVIRPVLEELARGKQKMDLIGPLPADTAFTPRQLQQCDIVVAMYHDQGLPVVKHVAFDRAVNITLGLPFVRTSVDHGTALALAGSGKASPANLGAAVACAIGLAKKIRGQRSHERNPG